MTERTFNITNFIGVYDGYISEEECDNAIRLFENQNKQNKTLTRLADNQAPVTQKQDTQLFASRENVDIWCDELKTLIINFDLCWRHYATNTGAEEAYKCPFHYTNLKIQKTLPTEGYHVWHVEYNKGYHNEARAFVYSIYLNDVEEGGETEFLHFSKRIKPKKGRIVIWPAAFPYLHRGNPPLSGEKYILTSWVLLRP
jgi:hypothetical protein|tara:strand:+ start:2470 stop:3066 length:597 start_codon:yes stop_codon:yes gene_type:complete